MWGGGLSKLGSPVWSPYSPGWDPTHQGVTISKTAVIFEMQGYCYYDLKF